MEQPVFVRWLSIGAEVHDPAPTDPFALLESRLDSRKESFLVRLSDDTTILGTYIPELDRWRVCAELDDGSFLYLQHVTPENESMSRAERESQPLTARQAVIGARALTDLEGMMWMDEEEDDA